MSREVLITESPTTGRHSNDLISNEQSNIQFQSNELLVNSFQPEEKMNRKTFFLIAAILLTELCERLTFYGVTCNMILFFQSHLQITDDSLSTQIFLIFNGFVYFIPVFGGFLADTVLGRFNTIFLAILIYFVGISSICSSALPWLNNSPNDSFQLNVTGSRITFFIGLLMLAVGTGGIKSNVSPFGAQQLEHLPERYLQSFFNWFYWFVNVGSLTAYVGVGTVQQNYSFFLGFLIPLISLLVAIIAFVLPKNHYVHDRPSTENPIKMFFMVLHNALTMARRRRHDVDAEENKLRSPLDYAISINGGKFSFDQVRDVRIVLNIFPVFFCLILFSTIYSQMATNFVLQSERFSLQVSSTSSFTIPVAWMSAVDGLIIILCAPLIDRVVYPLIRNYLRFNLTQLRRIGFGMLLASFAVLVAGGVEIARKNSMAAGNFFLQNISGTAFNASTTFVAVQIPQFSLVALAEIFINITSMEFAFSQAPKYMKSVIMGMYLMSTSLGNYFGTILVTIVKAATVNDQWLTEDINNGHLEYFFFLLSGLMLLNLAGFILIARRYKYIN